MPLNNTHCSTLHSANLPSGLDLGSGHELSIHCDALFVKLFRQIEIDEVYGIHWFDNDFEDSNSQPCRMDSHANANVDDVTPQSKKDKLKSHVTPSSGKQSTGRKRDFVKDRASPELEKYQRDPTPQVHKAPPVQARLPSKADVEAEEHYDEVLHELRTTNLLYQSRRRVEEARGSTEQPTHGSPNNRSAVCADLRNVRPAMSPPSSKVTLSKLADFFAPITRTLDKVPVVLRLLLWALTQSHPISCPSVCFTTSGFYLGDMLKNSMFREHAEDDRRISQLREEVSQWLTDADLYLDFTHLRGRGSVPIRTSNDITADLRSKEVVVTRIGNAANSTGRVATLTGADTIFIVPTVLLPSHAYLKSKPEKQEDDKASVSMSIRASLPAHFSDTCLSFLATLGKASQMLDIEEEAGLATTETSSSTASDTPCTTGDNEASHLHNFREKMAHGKVGSAIKHPVAHVKEKMHKEVKKGTVDKVDGAWFAKWTNKILRKLEGLDGDIGYSTEIPVQITRAPA